MKTGKIEVYEIFGTNGEFCACLKYRGKFIKDWCGLLNPQELLYMARKYAHANGFTHVNVSFG